MYDYAIVGAGMAGASIAYELATVGTVILIEAESRPGYHSSGRSAALFTPNYGNPTVCKINAVSHPFFLAPPEGLCDYPLLMPRGLLSIATPGAEKELDGVAENASEASPIERIGAAEILMRVPILRPEIVSEALFEPGVSDIDVDGLQQGYLRGFKARKGELSCGTPVQEIVRQKGLWHLKTKERTIEARFVINAAGAWADEIGALVGAAPIGLVPKRRSVIVVDGPEGVDVKGMPAVDLVGSEAYFKPEAGRIMASLGDETPTDPQDAWPEEMDIALIADWLERHTTISIRRVEHSWAGLRCFVADDTPVVGFDLAVENFFWLAGQGGYGIMMAPALASAAKSLIMDGVLSPEMRAEGVLEASLSPARLRPRLAS